MADTAMEIVRAGDKDMFLATLFAPEVAQPHLFAVMALAVEVARIPQLVSDVQIGEIRLQWWADTLESIGNGETQSHPVAVALTETVKVHSLPLAPLQALVEARRFDLYADVMPDQTAVEAYFGEIQAVLFQLGCMILAPEVAPAAATASGLSGVGFGLARSLTQPDKVTKLTSPQQSREDLMVLAEKRLAEANDAVAGLPRQLFPAFLPLSIAGLYLNAAKQGRTNVPQWRRQWRLWRAARTETVSF